MLWGGICLSMNAWPGSHAAGRRVCFVGPLPYAWRAYFVRANSGRGWRNWLWGKEIKILKFFNFRPS